MPEPIIEKKSRKLVIHRDPTKSPFNFFRKRVIEKKVKTTNQEEKFTNFNSYMDQLLQKTKMMDDDKEHNEKQYRLLKMIYSDDINADFVINNLDVTENELKSLVDELVEIGFLKLNSDDEAEITEDGIVHILHRESQI